jgi:hypothetical protein
MTRPMPTSGLQLTLDGSEPTRISDEPEPLARPIDGPFEERCRQEPRLILDALRLGRDQLRAGRRTYLSPTGHTGGRGLMADLRSLGYRLDDHYQAPLVRRLRREDGRLLGLFGERRRKRGRHA